MATFTALLQGLTAATLIASLAAHGGSKSIHCMTEGRFKDPHDCGSFIDCLPDREGGLVARHGSCKGQGFHPITKKCVDLKKMRGCSPRSPRAAGADNNLNYLCKEKRNNFICADCKTVVNCINGTAYPERCGNQDFCYESSLFRGGVCYPDTPASCTCDKPNDFKIDHYDSNSFFFCETMETDPVIYKCPEDMQFDKQEKQCMNKDGLPPCTSLGVFANPKNCSQYYTCIMTTAGWIHKKTFCNETGFMYNESAGKCEDPCLWNNDPFTCTKEGRFSDPTNCKNYFECINIGEDTFEQRTKECPLGFEWDKEADNGKGFCVKEGTGTCKTVTYNKCPIPEEQCITPTLPDSNQEIDTEEATFIPVDILPATLQP